MSRSSNDDYDQAGFLRNGYDYDNQCWVENYRVVRCGHPESMNCRCYGKLNEGKDTRCKKQCSK